MGSQLDPVDRITPIKKRHGVKGHLGSFSTPGLGDENDGMIAKFGGLEPSAFGNDKASRLGYKWLSLPRPNWIKLFGNP